MNNSSIELTGLEQIQARLAMLQKHLTNTKPIMAEIENKILNEIDEKESLGGFPSVHLGNTFLYLLVCYQPRRSS